MSNNTFKNKRASDRSVNFVAKIAIVETHENHFYHKNSNFLEQVSRRRAEPTEVTSTPTRLTQSDINTLKESNRRIVPNRKNKLEPACA